MSEIIKQYDVLAPIKETKPLLPETALGAEFVDKNGKHFLNLNEINNCLGYANELFIHRMEQCLRSPAPEKSLHFKKTLFKQLVETTKGDFQGILLTSSGSEAVEWAVRAARKRTGRAEILSFWNSIHGRTYLASSLSGFPVRKTGYGPIAPGIVFSPYPYCFRCEFGENPNDCNFRCLEFMKRKIEAESSQSIAAVIIEPLQGAGIIVPPPGYLRALWHWTAQNGIELILDEVQSGLGRLGCLYEYQRLGLVPDALLLGKGLGNGLQISALLVRDPLPVSDLAIMTGGAGDLPLSCAAASTVFDALLEGTLLKQIQEVGAYWQEALTNLQKKHPCIGDVRGRGLAYGIEFISNQDKKENEKLRKKVSQRLAEQGFLTGFWRSTIVLRPPFSLTLQQAEAFIRALAEILAEE